MASFSIHNVRIAGIHSCVPSNVVRNIDSNLFSSEDEKLKYIESVGVEERRVADDETCSSDLCYVAAENLIEKLGWEKATIDCLAFVSQTRDYIYPATACILQHRLGLSTDCMAFDIAMGCSGWVYGMAQVASIVQNGLVKRALLLNGETVSKTRSSFDKVNMITGDAGTATALEYDATARSMCFDLHTDGSGYQTIMIPAGGYRNPFKEDTLAYHTDEDGVQRNNLQTIMNGADVFAFAIKCAPQTIKTLIEKFSIDKESIDYYLLHQANMFINRKILKKIGCDRGGQMDLKTHGNTSSCSIPLLISSQIGEGIKNKKCIACAFGVGLSWGSVFFETDGNIIIPKIVEYEYEKSI